MNIKRLICAAAALPVLAAYVPGLADDAPNAAYAAFGVSGAECSGMTAANTGALSDIAEERDGKTGWRIGTSGAQANIRCNIDDSVMYGISGMGAVVEVEYYDDSYGGFCIYYDSRSGRRGEAVQLENSGEWRTKEIMLYDAGFANGLYTDDFWITTNRPDVMGVSSDAVLIGSVGVRLTGKAAPFEISVSSGRTGNIFFEDEEISFDVSYDNIGSETYELTPEYIVRSYDGSIVRTLTSSVSAAPSAADTVRITGLPYGVYTLEVRLDDERVMQSYTADFSYSRRTDETNYHYGMNIHYDDSSYTADDVRALSKLLKASGFGFVRSSLRWSDIEQSRGVYAIPENTMAAAQCLDELGLNFLGILYPENDLYGSYPYYQMSSTTLAAFERYCKFTAETLKDYTHHYCMLNEVNHDSSGYKDNEADYVRIAEAGYNGLKAGDPDAFINGGSLAGWSRDYANKTYELGILNYCDSYSMQIYNHSDGPETDWMFRSVTDHRYWLGQYDTTGTKQTWITESGWPTRTADDTYDESVNRDIANAHDSASEIEQAQWYARSMMINGDKSRADEYIYYSLSDDDADRYDIQSNFGILQSKFDRTPFAAKPAFIAVCAYNDLIGDAEFIEDDISDGSGWAYRYRLADGSVMTCVWGAEYYSQPGKGSVYTYTSDAPYIVVYDMYGNAEYIENTRGSYDVPIEEQPVYVTGADAAPEAAVITVTQSGRAVASLDGIDTSRAIDVTLAAQEGESVTFVCAMYAGDVLVSVEMQEAAAEGGYAAASFDASAAAGAETAKVMALKDTERLTPKAEVVSLGR